MLLASPGDHIMEAELVMGNGDGIGAPSLMILIISFGFMYFQERRIVYRISS